MITDNKIEHTIVGAWNSYVTSLEPTGCHTCECVSYVPENISFLGFRMGYISASKNLFEKDTEIERLETAYQQTLAQYDKTWKALGDCSVKLEDAEIKLEKADYLIQELRKGYSGSLINLAEAVSEYHDNR